VNEPIKRPGHGPERARSLARQIKRDVAAGICGPGYWLRQVDFEKRYTAPRLQVRHAIDSPAEKGLVRYVARRGYCVEEFSIDRLAPIICRMEAEARRCDDALTTGTVEDHEAANLAFNGAMREPRACLFYL
jgi:DNA-binding FadR family transcriptional regulator